VVAVSYQLFILAFLLLENAPMESKPRAQSNVTAAKRDTAKRGKNNSETARLFLDVDEVIRRSQAVPFTRYVE
jgi:hypothetical protein